ncbi:hypothetical protein HDU98_006568 [Podochytrium sp. JEL0797]|nr:hypothetical protein HDU98_006568 [Podochytrium sp. JEL0797]
MAPRPTLQDLPVETLTCIFVHVHPNQIAHLSKLCKLLYIKLYPLWHDFLFARANLLQHIASVRWPFLSMIRAKRTLNFWGLPLSYHAAFLSVYGLSLQSIDHFEVSFDAATFDAAFVHRGRRIHPAVKLAQEYKFMAPTKHNAFLLALFAGMAADLPLLDDVMQFSSADSAAVFSWACAANALLTVDHLLAKDIKPPASSLIVAANYGFMDIMLRLLPFDSPHPEPWFYSSTLSIALISACEKNQFDAAKHLLAHSDTVPTFNKNSALLACVSRGFVNLTRLLMETGKCDASDQDDKGILIACTKGYTEIALLLLQDSRVDPSAKKNTPLIAAVELGNFEIVSALLKTGRVDVSARENRAIQIASKEGFVEIVRALLAEPGVDPTASDSDALVSACRNGHTDIVQMLLKWVGPDSWEQNRCNAGAQDNACIIFASKFGHDRIVELLLQQANVNPSVNSNLPLFEAWFVESAKPDVSSKTHHSHTARPCSSNGQLKVLHFLSSRNLKVDHTVLTRCAEMASKNGHASILHFLQKNYNTFRDALSPACLLNSSQFGHLAVVEFLLAEIPDWHTQTLTRALAIAATFNRLPVVSRLVEIHTQYSFGPALVKAASLGNHGVVMAILHSSAKKVVVPHEAVMVAKDKAMKELLQAAIGKRV